MDPNETIRSVLDLMDGGDPEEVVEAAAATGDLLAWVGRGGFPPEGWTEDELGVLHGAVTRWRDSLPGPWAAGGRTHDTWGAAAQACVGDEEVVRA